MKDNLTTTALKQKERKPIKYWRASNGVENNSIAILRHLYGNSVTYKAIR